MNFLSLFTRSKSREETELQQGTPEVQKNLWNRKCAANETIRIKNAPTREEASWLPGIQLRKFSELPECQLRRRNYCFYLCVWHYGSSQAEHTGSSFYVPEVHYIWTWHSSRLICTSGVPCCSSVFTLLLLLVNKLKKFILFQRRHRKIWNHLASISLIIFSMSKGLNSHRYLVTLSL